MSPAEDSIDTEPALAEELQSLLRRAHENGIDVEGGWVCRNDAHPDWDVVVTELENRAESADAQQTSDPETVDD